MEVGALRLDYTVQGRLEIEHRLVYRYAEPRA